MYRRAVKRAGVRKMGRRIYKATGLVNPVKKGKLSTTRLAKDVAILKGIINSEKFRIESQPFDDLALGQVNGNSSGHFVGDFTPTPTQGDGYNNRQGQSIRWKSSHYSMFFRRQSGANGPCRIKIELIKVVGEPFATASNIQGRYIEPNRWITGTNVFDTASDRKPEYFKNFRTLRTVYVNFPAPQTSPYTTQQKIVNFGLKLPNHHVKWNNNSNTLTAGQVICLITMDTGNSSSTTVSTLDSIANAQINSGITMSCNKVDYYYDN